MKEAAWLKGQLNGKFLGLFCLLWLLFATPVFAIQKITDYSVQVKINNDSSVWVNEAWRYDFGTEKTTRLEKKVPLLIKNGSLNYRISLSNLNARDEKNNIFPVTVEYRGNQAIIEIDAAGGVFAGTKTMLLSYQINGAIRAGLNQDVFTWPVNGSGFDIGIAAISTQISLPPNIKQADVSTACAYGSVGSEKECSIDLKANNDIVLINYYSPNLLYANDLFTVNFSIPKGYIKYPSGWRQLAIFADNNLLVAIPVLIFLVGLWYVAHKNNKNKQRQAYSMRYTPPTDLSPMEMAYLLRGTVDRFDVAAEIFWVAIKGYLKIGVDYSQGAGSYALYKQRQNFALPNDFDNLIFNSMFDGGDAVYMVIWRDDLQKIMPLVTSSLKSSLAEKGYISKKSYIVGFFIFLLAIILAIVGWYAGDSFMPGFINQISLAAVGPIIFVLYLFSNGSAKQASVIQEEISGFTNYLQSKEMKNPNGNEVMNQNGFDEFLAYALVSNQAKNWLMHFADVVFVPPTWFIDPAWQDKQYSPYLLIEDLYNFRQILSGNK